MDRLAAECALLPHDVVYVRGRTTRRAAVAEVLNREKFPAIAVKLETGWCDWTEEPPKFHDCRGAVIVVQPKDLEEIRE